MSDERSDNPRYSLVPFFVLTYAITWGIAAFLFIFPDTFKAIFGSLSVSSPIFVLAVAAPTISATILTYVGSCWSGLRNLYAPILRWRFGIHWYLLVLVGLPLIGFADSRMAGSQPKNDLSTSLLVLVFLLRELILGPLGEELGWRGFALPRLLQRFNPLVSSLILGAIWGVWHVPSFFVSSLPQSSLAIPLFLFGALGLSILATWLFLHTGGSVLITVLFHLMVNVSIDAFGASFTPFALAMLLCAVLVVILDPGLAWLRREGSPPG
jgi:membrane protease YdiL (CAAX protease family)